MSPEQSLGEIDPQGDGYHVASRFVGEKPAGRAYQRTQELIYESQTDLSAFRLQLTQVWHVAVIGEMPPAELDRRLRSILATGEPTSLPDDVVQVLFARRNQIAAHTPWMEAHYRPGKSI